jgi:formylglycine-generating enzyme required for sulfatase activity
MMRTKPFPFPMKSASAALLAGALAVLITPVVALTRSQDAEFKAYTETLPNHLVKFEMLPIPEGSIDMPDPKNPGKTATVKLKRFWMGKTEVLWDLYDIYAFRLDQTDEEKAKNVDAESRPSKPYGAPDRGFGHNGYPALSMHQNAAEHFCKWLSAKSGKKYRLPTEAEWEYAARAGGSAKKLEGSDLEAIAWFWDNADDKTHPAGQLKPNAWGLVDMLGNVSEWVVMPEGSKPAVAGGSWRDKAEKVHPGFRDFYTPDWQAQDAHTPKSKWWLSDGPHIGMRLVREE